MKRVFETRTLPGYTLKADTETGIIDAYVSIFGIADDSWMNDIVEPGSFKKTIGERGPEGTNRIRVLWQHRISEVIGKPLLLEEHTRDRLPEVLTRQFPKLTGGLFTKTQLVMEVSRAREAFALYKSEAMNEWSIGFNTIASWNEELEKVTYRHLTEIRLWEFSPVTWGANPATTTVDVRSVEDFLDQALEFYPELNLGQIHSAVEKRLQRAEETVEPAIPLTANSAYAAASLRAKILDAELRLRGKYGNQEQNR